MDSSAGTNGTKRIELSDGQWADIRIEPAVTAADMRAAQLARIRDSRGLDLFLDTLATFPTRITAWSFGPVDQAAIDALGGDDTMTLVRALVGIEEETAAEESPLADSSDGTKIEVVRRRRRGSGSPGA